MIDVVHADEVGDYLGRRAGIVTRLAANGIDWVVVLGTYLTLIVGWALLLALLTNNVGTIEVVTPEGWITALMLTAILVLYLSVMWAVTGRTIGKQVVGLKVLRSDGRRLRYGRSLARALLCVFFPGTFGLMWVAVSSRNRSWQDVIVGTAVVYDWKRQVTPEEVRAKARAAHAASRDVAATASDTDRLGADVRQF